MVRIRGVYGSIVNDKGQLVGLQLFWPSWDDVKVRSRPPEARDEAPFYRRIGVLRKYSPGGLSAARARVRGVISFVSGRRLYMEDPPAASPFLARTPDGAARGCREASGYVGLDGLQLVLR